MPGIERPLRCGSLPRPLDPGRPGGPTITLHYAVLPALAASPRPDPVLFIAGGPGQSAIDLAGVVAAWFARLGNRRDIVLVDQRGTGRSAPLACEDDAPRAAPRPLADGWVRARSLQRLADCRRRLQALPHGDLRFYTTEIASADLEAVRRALGVRQFNLVGASYGTRVALDYQRQFPQAVRRLVLDGVAPPPMVLPAAFAEEEAATIDAVLAGCEADAGCTARWPRLRADWSAWLAGLPRELVLTHPLSGRRERVTVEADAVRGLVRSVRYTPALAAGLPAALAAAAGDDLGPLAALAHAPGGRGSVATGMHFSVVCSEDAPRLPAATAGEAGPLALYRAACADWPRGSVGEAFYRLPPAAAPALLLSGGADPATPPRWGELAAAALGARARHLVVPNAGHGVLQLGCVRDEVFRFIDDDAAPVASPGCAAGVPAPRPFLPPPAGEAAR